MSDYQSISRIKRPKTFQQVLGQDPIVTTLKNSIALNQTAQAYLFCGPHGTGKTTLARLFAKALNCKQLSKEFEPCNQCQSCLEIHKGSSLSVLEIDGASNRGIDDIRNLNESTFYATTENYKIYLIDEVHMLTKEAFNALLKTLEEPPKNVKFLLATTEPHKVLPTILSRCIRFDLHRLSDTLICQKLASTLQEKSIDFEPKALSLIARASHGSMRDAETLLEQLLSLSGSCLTKEIVTKSLGLLEEDLFLRLDQAFANGNEKEAFFIAKEVYEKGIDCSHMIEQLLFHLRDYLLGSFLAEMPEKKPSNPYTKDQLLYLMDYLFKLLQMKFSFHLVHLEMTLLHIIRSKNRVSLEQVLEHLESVPEKKPLPSLEIPKEIKKEEPVVPLAPPSKKEEPKGAHFDTLVQFAAVELGGSLDH